MNSPDVVSNDILLILKKRFKFLDLAHPAVAGQCYQLDTHGIAYRAICYILTLFCAVLPKYYCGPDLRNCL